MMSNSSTPYFDDHRDSMRSRLGTAAQDPSTVLIAERDGPPLFPPVCPNCGQGAHAVLPVRRAFAFLYHSGEGHETIRSVEQYRVPFCEACARQHAAEQAPLSPWVPVLRVLKGDGTSIGGLIVFGVGLFFLSEAIRQLSLVLFAFACLPLLVGGLLVRVIWSRNLYMTVAPPTSISGAVDFTPQLSKEHESPWRAFSFRNASYASRFREANAARLWNPNSAEARAALEKRRRSSHRTMWIASLVLAAGLVWWLWDEVLSPFWPVGLRR